MATWLVGCAGLLPMVDPFHRRSPPDSWIPLLQMGKRNGLRCDFYTSAKGMWLPHLPRLSRADCVMGSYAGCLLSKEQHPFLHAVTTKFSGHFYSQS
ncbi:hypothetical protein EVA_09823 [gut metagenome]|uniref:Uncharacterized protein n=1 Tax=gut metagenome TaxID=749906 RepID=J9G4F4_9ZZZZ